MIRPVTSRPLSALLLAACAFAFVPPAAAAPVRVVLMTHIEDNTPAGTPWTVQYRNSYLNNRRALIDMAELCDSLGVKWTLQPDWRLLEAALVYEDSATRATTGGKNFLRRLADDLGVAIDPHSHENGGRNYTDVAHLLDSLGVGGSTVIGGHIWDPSLPEFQEWDRFRVPVRGQRHPNAEWRGDILIGAGTPNHVNDPKVSGVWRPMDRDHYFTHAADSNIVAVGSYGRLVSDVAELIGLYRDGTVPPNRMLTFTTNLRPAVLLAPGGLASLVDTVFTPLLAWRDSGLVELTDFTTLVADWQSLYGGEGWMYDAAGTVGVPAAPAGGAGATLAVAGPNPIRGSAALAFTLAADARVRLSVHDLLGREVAVLARGALAAGAHAARWGAAGRPAGVYFARLEATEGAWTQVRVRKLVLVP